MKNIKNVVYNIGGNYLSKDTKMDIAKMNNNKYTWTFSKITFDNFIAILLSFFAVIIIVVTFVTLNLGMTMRDEGWYLYLLKDQPLENNVTQFFLFFKNIFGSNIYAVRLTVFFTDLISASIFSVGLYVFFKQELKLNRNSFISLLSLSILGLYIGHISVNYVFSYITMNREVTLASFGFLLLALSTNKKFGDFLLILSGFLIGNLFFIMITNTPLILFILLFLYVKSEYRGAIKWFLIGVLLSIVSFFVFFQPITIFWDNLCQNIDQTLNNKFITNHGGKSMIKWTLSTISYFAYEVFPFFMMLIGVFSLENTSKTTPKLLIYSFVLLFFCIYSWINIIMPSNKVATMVPFLALMFLAFYQTLIEMKRLSHLFLLFVIFSSSLFLSFGSDTSYAVRSNYLVFVLPIVYMLFFHLDRRVLYLKIFTGLLFIYFLIYLTLPFRTNWAQIKYIEQKIPVSTININQCIKLDNNTIEELKQLNDENILKQNVILSSMFSWGYMYLLECKPVSYRFNLYENSALNQLSKIRGDSTLVLVEEKNSPHFKESFIEKVYEKFGAKHIDVRHTNIHNLYFLHK